MIDIENLYKWHEEYKELEYQQAILELIDAKKADFLERLERCKNDIKTLKKSLNEKTIKNYATDIFKISDEHYQIIFVGDIHTIPQELIGPAKRYDSIDEIYKKLTDGRFSEEQNEALVKYGVTGFKDLQYEYKKQFGYFLDIKIKEEYVGNMEEKITIQINLFTKLWL